jgi:hypothetical protein
VVDQPGRQAVPKMLAKHGFKTGGAFEPGGWRCYITDVIKSAYYAGKWKLRPEDVRLLVAEAWAPVLRFELEAAKPKLVVILGKKTAVPLDHLRGHGLIPHLPKTTTIYHYSCLGSLSTFLTVCAAPERRAERSTSPPNPETQPIR